jgi:histidinol-phosphate aminotransferase
VNRSGAEGLAGAVEAAVRALVRPEVAALESYAVAHADGLLKLDAMESPYRWPAPLVEAWLERLRAVELNRYPPASPPALRAALGEWAGIPAGFAVMLGNGSDELLQLVALCLARPGARALVPVPSFSMYRPIARLAGLELVEVPLRTDFALDLPALRAAYAAHAPALTFLASPNNPTGVRYPDADVAALLEAATGLVVLDEAYVPFAGASLAPWLARHPNLVLLRTLSKVGLAGLRLGFLAAHPAWHGALDRARLPYNVGTLALASAAFALEHRDWLDDAAARVVAARERLVAELRALPGLTAVPSAANFVLVRAPAGRGRMLHEALRAAGILVKDFASAPAPLTDCLRITVGTPPDHARVLAALAGALGA